MIIGYTTLGHCHSLTLTYRLFVNTPCFITGLSKTIHPGFCFNPHAEAWGYDNRLYYIGTLSFLD